MNQSIPFVRSILIIIVVIWQLQISFAQIQPIPLQPLKVERIKEIALLLRDEPAGFGDPCSKRGTWDHLLHTGKYDQFLEKMKTFEFPAFSKEDYFSLSDGSASSSSRGLNMMRIRATALSKVTWAECLENKGRFLKMLENGLQDIIDQKSWVSPRNDYDFKNYNGIEYSVELTSALYAHTIAQTLYLMGDKLNPELRKKAIAALRKRVFDPVINKIKTQNNARENKFLEMTNNYNHVCLSGVVGAALSVLDDKYERAMFTYIGEWYSQNGLMGFGDDGYCSEGVGYYNYGFGHFLLLRENIWQATNGKLDLFANPKVEKIANFIPDIEVINGVFPTISDSKIGVKPDACIMTYLSRNFGLGLTAFDTLNFEGKTDDIRYDVMMVFPNSASVSKPKQVKTSEHHVLRSYFDQTGVLVTRPLPNSTFNMGAAIKGGNNKENHNHNDLGSYTIVCGNEIIAGDPGAIPYTSNIFNDKFRYTYKTISSFGHPVPLVSGKEQQPGAQAHAKITRTAFNRNSDELVMDIASAYNVPELKKLERTFVYNRTTPGNVTISDEFGFSQPENFETAIVTRATWNKLSENTLLLKSGEEKVEVSFSSPGNNLSLRTEKITEGGTPYTRIGIYTNQPLTSGKIVITYKPIKI